MSEFQLPITVRIPTEQYGYVEVVYPSAKDFASNHLDLVKIITTTMDDIEKYKIKFKSNKDLPF